MLFSTKSTLSGGLNRIHDEIPRAWDEIRLDGGWVDLISSEAKAEDFIRACEDFIVQSTISLKTQGCALIYLQNYGIIISTTLSLTKVCNCMKYISVNKLSDFEFHDAEFALEIFDNKCLKVKAIYLNIHKDAEQNQHVTDMEINLAYITFEEFNLLSYEPGVAWKQDEHGEFHPTGPQIILTDEYARARFLEQLKNGLTIFALGEKEPNTYFIDAMSIDPFFTVCFNFKNASIEWDEYNKQAWYVSK